MNKLCLPIVVAFFLSIVACSAVNPVRDTPTPTYTPAPPTATHTAAPTQVVAQPVAIATPTPTPINVEDIVNRVVKAIEGKLPSSGGQVNPPASQPTAQSVPAQPAVVGDCKKHGTIAWQNHNLPGNEHYATGEIGGLDEPCGVVFQTWTQVGKTERFVVFVPPHSFIRMKDFKGGTGWYYDSATYDVPANLKEQNGQLIERDGEMPTTQVVLPTPFRLLVEFRSKAAIQATPGPSATPTAVAQPVAATPMPAAQPTQAPAQGASSGQAGICTGSVVVGPVIIEYGPPSTVQKVNANQTANKNQGGCFSFTSQAALDARWPEHKTKFLAKYPSGRVVE